ncbi:MAG: SpoIID/LytB domain-containing protein, partial [Clostridia bacterium]|nr:SpoIID/LytB domain-containing protein [Clostridia bacterium]
MSNLNPGQTPGRKRTKEEKKKLATRIVALLMAILMVAGAAYYAISLMTMSISASDVIPETEIVNTSSLHDGGDVPVRVGLMYGDGITVGFEVTATAGFVLGITETTGNYDFTPIWELNEKKLSATTDGNLSKRNMTYSVAANASDAVVGGFHVQVDCDKYDREQYTAMLGQAESALAGYGLDVIPAYVYTGYTIRAGEFTTRTEAEEWVETVQDIFPDDTVYVTGASKTSVSLIEPETDRILFEYDCGGETELGLQAKEDENGNAYLKTPAANVYAGTFVFSRYDSGSTDGVALTNILPLEAYIAGVLPYEISNDWPLEALKAFAVTVRSFTLTHMDRHSELGFDMCNNAHCQVYKGAGRVNRSVMEAVTGTAGQVMTYNGEIVGAYYSSSMGGTTVSAKDAWGGDIPYLQAKATPWEDYMNHENAFWIVEMTPSELAERLRQAGHDVRGYVADIRILQLAENSTYVKILQV